MISSKNCKKHMSLLSLLHLSSSAWSPMPPPEPAGKGEQRWTGPMEGGGTEQWQQLVEGEPGPWQALSLARAPQKQGAREQE